ncbi:MAG: hypothetical protein QM692_02350 [Thermomicrobiales bacterium]
MDSSHFATVARQFITRRTGFGLGLAALAGIPVSEAEGKTKRKKACPPCKKRKKGKCKRALPDGTACAGGTCTAGQCASPEACGSGGPCLVFLSSSLHTGALGGLSGADAICQSLAAAASQPGSYKAWLSDATGSALSRFVQSPGPYRLVNGTRIASSFADLTDGSLLTQISVTETGGNSGVTEAVFTGTNIDGNASLTASCGNWMNAAGGGGGAGRADVVDANWTTFALGSCGIQHHLYCFQQH